MKKQTKERRALIDEAIKAINAVADDKSVSHEDSIVVLEGLQSQIHDCIDGLECDISNRDEK